MRDSSFIIDSSVTMTWCFHDETTEYTENILNSLETHTALVPNLWSLEVCYVFLMAQNCDCIHDSGIFCLL